MIDLDRLLAPLRARVMNMIGRAVLTLVDDSTKMQLLQVSGIEDESLDEVERFQDYGFTSVPLAGAEAVVVRGSGQGDQPYVIAVDDRRYRVRNLESGEVAVYNDSGSYVVLKASGDIQIVPSSGTVSLTGDLDVSGTVTATVDVVGGGKSLSTHTHTSGALLDGSSAAVTGSTGTPV